MSIAVYKRLLDKRWQSVIKLETDAAHAHAVAAVAEHLAWRERTQADAAQRVLS